MMHVNMINALIKGMSKMKFVVNHNWLFERPYLAFCTGFAQALMTVLVTLVNYVVIAQSTLIMECVMDFLAVKIITEIDDFFFLEHRKGNETSKKLISDESLMSIFTIRMTTSRDAQPPKIENTDAAHVKAVTDKLVMEKMDNTEWLR